MRIGKRANTLPWAVAFLLGTVHMSWAIETLDRFGRVTFSASEVTSLDASSWARIKALFR